MVNQIEFHPGFLQEETVKYCQDNGILVEAWSPLGSGRVLENPILLEIAENIANLLPSSVSAGVSSMMSFRCRNL